MKLLRALAELLASHVILSYHFVCGLVTLQTILDITNVTDECRERIIGRNVEGELVQQIVGLRELKEQNVMSTKHGDEDRDDIEDVVAASIKVLCSTVLIELEKPLEDTVFPSEPSTDDLRCRVITREYHEFLGATVNFLFEVQQKQMRWRWDSESPVFDGISWLQGLWASRSTNSQERSFIEQQMAFYGPTGCFGKSQEVLRRDVEIVEYMNDLIDSFP